MRTDVRRRGLGWKGRGGVAVAVALMLGAVGEGEARGSKPKPPKVPERLSELGVKLDQAVTSAGGRDLWGTVLVAKGGEILISALLREVMAVSGEFHFAEQREVPLKGFKGVHQLTPLEWKHEPSAGTLS